jgi:hypothetical protein
MNTKVATNTATSARMRDGSSLGKSREAVRRIPVFRSVADSALRARRGPAGAPPGGAHERGAAGAASVDARETGARRSWPTERIHRRSPTG